MDTFPDRPVFLVYEAGEVPPPLPGLTTTVAGRFAGTMPHWVESSISRPASAQQIPYDFTVYRVPAAGLPGGRAGQPVRNQKEPGKRVSRSYDGIAFSSASGWRRCIQLLPHATSVRALPMR